MGVARLNHRGRAKAATAKRGSAPSPANEGTLHFTIASDRGEGHETLLRILSEIERHGYDEASVFAMRLALEEALVNAIKHGNKLDPNKKVHVEASVTPRRVEFVVEDEGPGFKRSGIPDPRVGCNVDRCCGRGLLLMESYMDRVEYSHGGRRVRMVKKNRN
jgi:serine/threonine-protein kinase RsbW